MRARASSATEQSLGTYAATRRRGEAASSGLGFAFLSMRHAVKWGRRRVRGQHFPALSTIYVRGVQTGGSVQGRAVAP